MSHVNLYHNSDIILSFGYLNHYVAILFLLIFFELFSVAGLNVNSEKSGHVMHHAKIWF
jgi:hypothetical protein